MTLLTLAALSLQPAPFVLFEVDRSPVGGGECGLVLQLPAALDDRSLRDAQTGAVKTNAIGGASAGDA